MNIHLILLNLAVLFALTLSSCKEEVSTPDENSQITVARLSASELEYYSSFIANQSPRLYHSLSFRIDENGIYQVGYDTIEAYLISRPVSALDLTVSGLWTDGNRNQILRSTFITEDNSKHDFSITVSANRDLVISVDMDQDENLDIVVQRVGDNLISVMTDIETLEVLRCVEGLEVTSANLFESILDCLSKFRNGGGGGWDQLHEMADAFLNPECEENTIVSDRPIAWKKVADRYDRVAQYVEYRSGGSSRHQPLANAYRQAARILREMSAIEEALQRPDLTDAELSELSDSLDELSSDLSRFYGEIARGLSEFRKDYPIDPIEDPSRPSEGAVSHPRCQQRDTDTQRGTLFTNIDFCPDADFIQCIRRQNSALYALTEGQCYIEEGPSGGDILVCEETERLEDIPILPPDDENSPYNPDGNDDLDPNAPQGSNGQIAESYVNLTPLGDFIIGLCSQGGCPRE